MPLRQRQLHLRPPRLHQLCLRWQVRGSDHRIRQENLRRYVNATHHSTVLLANTGSGAGVVITTGGGNSGSATNTATDGGATKTGGDGSSGDVRDLAHNPAWQGGG